jgi:16S rRNA (cytosine1402-N4)-methyltransferase
LNPRAVIFDLGLSSFQLSDKERGFSFDSKNLLNMEMGMNKYSAYDVINTLDKEHLAIIIKVLGGEKDGKIIANKIDKYRSIRPIKTSKELASIIGDAKKNYKNYKRNPATKTFQAIRIFVNQELTELILGLIEAAKLLSNEGILIVVSFHSLEDKIVKSFFNLYSNLRKNPSRYLPIKKNKSSLFKLISKKPLMPDIKEIKKNIRSRSAKLRYAIRNNNSFFYPNEFRNKFMNYFELESSEI